MNYQHMHDRSFEAPRNDARLYVRLRQQFREPKPWTRRLPMGAIRRSAAPTASMPNSFPARRSPRRAAAMTVHGGFIASVKAVKTFRPGEGR